MSIVVIREPLSALQEHGRISTAFRVDHRFVPGPEGSGLESLVLEPVEPPYVKDYDRDAGHGPEGWPERSGATDWGVFGAFEDSIRIGGALVGANGPDTDWPGGCENGAVLWDLRVAPAHRGRGVGSALFRSVLEWAHERQLASLIVETQNVNVPACRFYERQGCRLVQFDREAYPDHPDEARLIWTRDLRCSLPTH